MERLIPHNAELKGPRSRTSSRARLQFPAAVRGFSAVKGTMHRSARSEISTDGRAIMTIRHILAVAFVMSAARAHAGSSRDGTWAGALNNEPVSVTIASGKVVGYTIRGTFSAPYRVCKCYQPLRFDVDRPQLPGENYQAKLYERTRRGSWLAHGPLGDGIGLLRKQ